MDKLNAKAIFQFFQYYTQLTNDFEWKRERFNDKPKRMKERMTNLN